MGNARPKIKTILDAALAGFLVFLLVVSVFNVLWQVATRFLMQNPSSFTEEVARFLLIWISFIGAAYAFGQKSHIAMDYLFQKFPVRVQRGMEYGIWGSIVFFTFSILVVGGIFLVGMTLELNQISPALRLPMGYVYLSVPFSGVAILMYLALEIRQHRGKGEE